MWKEMVFEPEVEKVGTLALIGESYGMVTKSAKDLMIEFLNEERIRSFRVAQVYDFSRHYNGDTTCYQIFYYDSSVYRPAREI